MSTQAYLFSLSTHPETINVKSLDVYLLNPKIDFSNYDYLIITSKQAVEALKQYKKSEYTQKQALAISKKSAQAFEKIGGRLLEIGEGYGSNISQNIEAYPKETKWLYLRASVIASDFVRDCKCKGHQIDEVVVYESHCSQEIQKTTVPEDATLIFTSPSSVICFLKHHTISTLNKVIVIGKTTAKALPEGVHYALSSETTIDSCVELFKNL